VAEARQRCVQAPRPGPLSRSASQPATRAMAQSRPINPNQGPSSRHSDDRLLRTANYCQAPRPDWIDWLAWPLPPACVFHAPGRAAGRCVFRALSPNRSPAAAQTSLISTPRPPTTSTATPSALSSFASGPLLFTRYGTSCPVPRFSPFTCTLGLPRHTTLVPPPQTASRLSSIPTSPHPPTLPLFLFVLPAWSATVLSALLFFTSTANLSNLDLQRIVHRLPRLHNAAGDAFTLTTRLCPTLSTFHTRHCRPSGIPTQPPPLLSPPSLLFSRFRSADRTWPCARF
jgi:hypothetical protein